MQSGGQSAGIQLQVGLDLAFFRNQLVGLQSVASGTKLSFGVAFNRLDIQNELNALGANIKKRTYRLEVATNLSAEIKNAGTLAKALRGLDNAVQKNKGIANRTVAGVTGGTVDASKIQTLVNKATKPALQALYSEMSKAKIPMTDVGDGAVKDLRKAIVSGVPGITQDLAKGLANGLNPGLKENGTKGAKTFIDAFKTATGIASPSKVFKALGEFSADGLEIGFLNGLKDFKSKSVAEIRKIVALMQFELAKVSNVAIAPGMSRPTGGQGSRGHMSPIGPLPEGSKEPWAFSQYRYQPFMAQPGQTRGAGVPPMRERFPFAAAPSIMGTTTSPSMFGASFPALPPAGMTGGNVMRQAELQSRMATAYARSAAREASVLGERQMYASVSGQVPLGNTAPRLPAGNRGGALALREPVGGSSGGGGMGGIANFANALGSVNLPGTGAVREIGSEFAMAAKQVLLFGTAYKALAFLTSFPSQVGESVGALQSFRNTLSAISPTAQEAAASSEFILNIVDKYNVPLQSARDGFTKLYASMAPTGFSGNEIRDLFTGISQAAATFGMSSDKVDRVTYAFAQMASKGQVMSEELKGQLGDVLPGAMGIFAKAAGFEGADAIQKFGKALEDGAYKGKPLRALLKNVTIELKKEFGPGAEGAARTYQGVMTRMANSTKLLYESFEPVAINFLNSVVVPLTSGLKTITEGVRSYFQGQKAATPEAQDFNNVLKTLMPSLGGIAQNIGFALKQLLPLVQIIGAVAVQISRFLALPLMGHLAGTYLQVMLLTSGFRLLATSGLASAVLATIQFIRQGILAASVMVGLRVATQQTTLATDMFGKTVQTVMIKTVIGIALVAIGALIAKIMELRGQLSAIGNDAKGMENLAKSSAKMGDVEGTKEAIGNIKDRLATFKELQKELKGAKKTSGGSLFDDRSTISTSYQISSNTAKKLIELGVLNEKVLTKTSSGYSLLEDQMGTVNALVNKNVDEFTKAGQKGNILIDQATRKSKTQKTGLENLDLSGGDSDAEAKKAEQERLRIESERQRRRIEAANHENSLMQINFQKDLQLTDAGFEHKKNMIDALHDYEMSGLNDMEARQKKFEKDLQDVQLQRVNAVRQALQKAVEAQVATQAAANVSRAAGGPAALSLPGPVGGGGAFDTGMRTGPSSAIGGSAPYHQDIMFGSTVSMKERVQLMDQLARGYEAMGRTIEFSNDAVKDERYRSSMSYEAKSSLISRAQAAHASRSGGSGRAAMDYYAPLASSNRFGASVEGQAMLAPSVEGASYSYGGGGGGGRTMTASRNGKMVFEQLHGSMAVPLQSGAASKNATVNTMARRETTEARDEEKAQAQESAALSLANLDIQNKIALAYQQTATIIKQNIDSIYPIEKIKLENKLSQIRHDLQMQNMPEEVIAYEEKRAAAMEEGAMAEEVLKKNVANTEAEIKRTTAATTDSADAARDKSNALKVLNNDLELYKKGLADLPAKQQEMNVRLLEGALAAMKNADALKAQQETMSLIKSFVESASSSYKGFMKEVAMGGDPSEALKKFQEAITDQVLTVFFDFAMKPVEDFFKNQLSAMFGIETEESARKKAIATAENQLAELKRAKELQANIDKNVATLTPGGTPAPDTPATSTTTSFSPSGTSPVATNGFPIAAPGGIVASMTEAAMNGAALPFETGTADAANPVGAWGDSLNTQLSESLTKATKTTDTEGNKLGESLGKVTQGIGIAAGAIMGIAAGISQIKEGGTGNTLMGIGSILASLGGAIGGFTKLFGANGGVAGGGWKPFPVSAFANGGMVKGPTLGLVGEGKYNEAIVPLPDGRSIPVQMRGAGGSGSRDLLANQAQSRPSPSVLSMSFQTTRFGNTEYVDVQQLQQAMDETKRAASRDGASKGASLALDRLQNSPSARRKVGLR